MKVTPADLPGLLMIEPRVFTDARGHFFESFNERAFAEATGLTPHFVQDNQSRSARHVVRGLHYQLGRPQAKLLRVVHGDIFDVCVDIRRSSPTFRKWSATRLSSENRRQLWIPEGFAHGFLVLSKSADVLYKTTDYYVPAEERTILWNDPALAIAWPRSAQVILSDRDAAGTRLADADLFD